MTDPWAERRALSELSYADDPTRYTGDESEFGRWAVEKMRGEAGVHEVVEIGAGPGRDSRWIVGEGYRLRTVDFAPTAVHRALETRAALKEPFRSRWTVAEGDATGFLLSLPAGRTDAVLAHLVYATFSPEELTAQWVAVHRALRPGGLHLYGVRDRSDPLARKGSRVGPGTCLGGPHSVAYRYFGGDDFAPLNEGRFDPIELRRLDARHQILLADRRRPDGPPSEDHSAGQVAPDG